MKAHPILWVIVALHFALACAYAAKTPYREGGRILSQAAAPAPDIGAPDERQHVNYVRHLQAGKGFPVFTPGAPDLYETYQSHQPPLFYLVAAAASSVMPDLEQRSGGLALRIFNALIGSLSVLGVFFFVLWGFGNKDAAAAAAAFAALLPMNVALSGAVSNDPLLFALSSWTLATAAWGIRNGWTTRTALACGVLMGLAFLTKTNAVSLWPAVAVGIYFGSKQIKLEKPALVFGLALALPLAIAAPWWIRNLSLYGDPLAMKAFTDAFQGSPQASLYIQAGGPMDYWITGQTTGTGVLWWTLRSFIGVFGYMDVFLPKPVYIIGLLAVATLLVSRFAGAKERESAPVRVMGGLYFFVVLALFLRFNAQYFQGQARYILQAMAPIAGTLGFGAVSLVRNRPGLAFWLVAVPLLALNLYVLTILGPEFQRRVGM
jgi:4-amino-4-deoxy-L-arabinose transferase-like glycosyltransferase